MPQLDPNTFINQYFGIIVLFVIVYSLLSYIVLPLTLRALLLRNRFLELGRTTSELNTTLSVYRELSLTSPGSTRASGLLTNLFLSVTTRALILINTVRPTPSISNVNYFHEATVTSLFGLTYLSLFILLDTDETIINNE